MILCDKQGSLGHPLIDPHITHNVASRPFRPILLDPLNGFVVCQSELAPSDEIIEISRIELEINGGVTTRKRNDTTCSDITD